MLEVDVVRSTRRKKTAQARLVGNVLEVRVPARLSATEVDEMVAHFVARFDRQRSADAFDLEPRAISLAHRHVLAMPSSIRWVDNQQHRWGSCTPERGTIRLSDRLLAFPDWVIDYVIVHELAHLTFDHHGPEFWLLVERYPLAERARGYLIAKGGED